MFVKIIGCRGLSHGIPPLDKIPATLFLRQTIGFPESPYCFIGEKHSKMYISDVKAVIGLHHHFLDHYHIIFED